MTRPYCHSSNHGREADQSRDVSPDEHRRTNVAQARIQKEPPIEVLATPTIPRRGLTASSWEESAAEKRATRIWSKKAEREGRSGRDRCGQEELEEHLVELPR